MGARGPAPPAAGELGGLVWYWHLPTRVGVSTVQPGSASNLILQSSALLLCG